MVFKNNNKNAPIELLIPRNLVSPFDHDPTFMKCKNVDVSCFIEQDQ